MDSSPSLGGIAAAYAWAWPHQQKRQFSYVIMCALMLSGTSGQEMPGMDIVDASGVAWAPGPVANLHHEVTRQRASIQKDKHNLAVECKTLQSSMIYFVGGRLPHYMGQPCRGIDNYITIIIIITIIVKSILMGFQGHRFPTYSPIRGNEWPQGASHAAGLSCNSQSLILFFLSPH